MFYLYENQIGPNLSPSHSSEDKTLQRKCGFNSNEDMRQLPCPQEPESFGSLPSFFYHTGFCNVDYGNRE